MHARRSFLWSGPESALVHSGTNVYPTFPTIAPHFLPLPSEISNVLRYLLKSSNHLARQAFFQNVDNDIDSAASMAVIVILVQPFLLLRKRKEKFSCVQSRG